MTISRQKSKAKAQKVLSDVISEMQELSENNSAYTNLIFVPSGRKLIRYAKKANLTLKTSYMFGALRFVHFV